MTNEAIIFENACRLMKEGVIGTTGRIIKVPTTNGGEMTMAEPEPIHTFNTWKELGFSVKKGEHAIAKFTIWKYKPETIKNENGEDEESGTMFMKVAHFFKGDQVEPIGAKAGA